VEVSDAFRARSKPDGRPLHLPFGRANTELGARSTVLPKDVVASAGAHCLAEETGTLSRWVFADAENLKKLRLIRVDLRRAMQMHRPLVLGVSLCGVLLAALFLFHFWTATSGPQHDDDFRVILEAVVLLLISLVAGIATGVAALRMDPRIYVGSDLEQVLGVDPIEELPDFAEIPAEVASERLEQLARRIALACKEGSLKRCLFTGVGRGAGATTIAAGVRESLQGSGRRAILVGAADEGPEGAVDAPDIPALQGAADESGSQQDSLILTDTSPITESPDTEFLARFADCVMVVVESGVTTREQLMNTVSCLKRLNVGAVGFVMNRVKLANADAEFRRAVERQSLAVEGSAQNPAKLFASAMQRALADPAKKEPAARQKPVAAARAKTRSTQEQTEPAIAKPDTALAIVKAAPQSSVRATAELPSWLIEALAQVEERQQSEKREAAEVATEPMEDAKGTGGLKAADEGARGVSREERVRGNASNMDEIDAILAAMDLKDPFGDDDPMPHSSDRAQPFFRPNVEDKPSRLSGLRGMASADSLKELDRVKQQAARWSEPFRTMDEAAQPEADSAGMEVIRRAVEAGARTMDETPRRQGESLSSLRGIISPEGLKDLNRSTAAVAEEGTPAEDAPSEAATAQAMMEPVQEAAAQDVASIAEPEGAAAAAETESQSEAEEVHEQHTSYGEVQILPSKRGQYKRKT
jgi:hypothetical protein